MFWSFSTLFFSIFLIFSLSFIFLMLQNIQMLKSFFKSAFECGFNMKNKPYNIFSTNYFYMTIIFLIFDLEILLMMPIILYKNSNYTLFLMLFFLNFFIYILSSEWENSILEWK